jgi:hypothetical protein
MTLAERAVDRLRLAFPDEIPDWRMDDGILAVTVEVKAGEFPRIIVDRVVGNAHPVHVRNEQRIVSVIPPGAGEDTPVHDALAREKSDEVYARVAETMRSPAWAYDGFTSLITWAAPVRRGVT